MNTMLELDLEQLIAPLSLTTFLAQYWEKRPLIIKRSRSDYYTGTISMRDVDTLLKHHRIKYPNIKLGKAEKGGFSIELLEGMNPNEIESYGVPLLYRLSRAYTQGDTIVLNRLNNYWEPLATFCRNLEQFFTCPVGANVYLSPKNSQAFPPHFDLHDIFVLQVEGSKHWKLYDLADKSYSVVNDPDLKADQDVDLEAGDLLYIPRQYVHSVCTTDSHSMHISIGVDTFSSKDLLASAFAAIDLPHSLLQEAVPISFMTQTQPEYELECRFVSLLRTAIEDITVNRAITLLAHKFIESMSPLPRDRFHQNLCEIDQDTQLQKAQGAFCYVMKHDTQVSIKFPGNEVFCPDYCEPVLQFIAETDSFTLRSLPNVLSESSKLVLVRRLIREGLVTVVKES